MYGNIHRHEDGARPTARTRDVHYAVIVVQMVSHVGHQIFHRLPVKHILFIQGTRTILQNYCDASGFYCCGNFQEQVVCAREICK